MSNKVAYLGSGLGLIVIAIFATLINAGVFKTIEAINAQQCHVIDGIVGAEDMTFIPGTNMAFVSAYDRRIERADPTAKISGGIYLYDLDAQDLIKVSPEVNDFKPHGISLYQGEQGEIRLFVVDHANQQHQVQIFEYKNQSLTLLRTILAPEMISPNDIVAVGPEQFYVSNDHGFVTGIMRTLEDYLMLPLSNVLYFDGEQAQEVASGLAYANGMNVDASGTRIYVAGVTSLSLYVYERDLKSNALTLIEKINTGTGVDNIELDEKGDLWIGAHPQLLKFVAHSKQSENRSASQVIKIKASDGSFDMETVYQNNGDPISGSSVAAVKGPRMLIGSVFDPIMLDCTL